MDEGFCCRPFQTSVRGHLWLFGVNSNIFMEKFEVKIFVGATWDVDDAWTTWEERISNSNKARVSHSRILYIYEVRQSLEAVSDEGVIYLLSHAHSICWIPREWRRLLQTLLRACRYYVDISTILSKGHSHVTSEFFWEFGPRTLSPLSLSISRNL